MNVSQISLTKKTHENPIKTDSCSNFDVIQSTVQQKIY